MKINLPNQVTIARLVLTIVFLAVLSRYSAESPSDAWLLDVCGALFVVAAVSDILDGYLARKYNQVTSFGRVIDPCVDKVLVCGAFVYFSGSGFVRDGQCLSEVAPWMTVVIIAREMLVTGLRGFSEAKGDAFGAKVWGKVKMAMQCVVAGYILFTLAHVDGSLRWHGFATIRCLLVWAGVVITVLSALTYIYAARGILTETSRPAEPA
jgi:CDP-diacylglycerol---glycerol-3-phosphate 3-phosphatidyltransferase